MEKNLLDDASIQLFVYIHLDFIKDPIFSHIDIKTLCADQNK